MPKQPENTSSLQQSFIPSSERYFDISWQDKSTLSSGNYQISYSFTPQFTSPTKIIIKNSSQTRIMSRSRFGIETLYWKIQILDEHLNPIGEISPMFSQQIRDKIKLSLAEIISHPLNSTVILQQEQRIQNLHFKWRPVAMATHYQVQLAKDANFNSTFLDTIIPSTELPFNLEITEDKLDLYVRVRAQANDAEESIWPVPIKISYYLQKFIPPVQLQSPRQDQILQMGDKMASVSFAWTHPHDGLHYLVFICNDKKCQNKETVKLTKHKSSKISLPTGKRYYWKVYSLYPYPENFAGDYRQLRQSCPDSNIGNFLLRPQVIKPSVN